MTPDGRTRRRWGFRARLTVLIAAIFIAGGGALLTVQYLLTRRLFDAGVSEVTGCISGDGGTIAGDVVLECGVLSDESSVLVQGGGTVSLFSEQSSALSAELFPSLLLWSVVVLVAFAGLAVLAASWLSRRSLSRIARITETTRDITRADLHRRLALPGPDDEIKELGDTIDGMLDRLDEAFTRQERFVAAASHELRTPLTTTRAALEIPLEQGRVPAAIEPDVRRALAANARSERIIAALLELARGAHGASAAEIDLADVLREAVAERGGSDRSAIAVEQGGPARARADAGLIGIAVGNLVENALRYGDGTVVARCGADAGAAWIEVENDGERLGAEEAAKLVEPFNRGGATRLAGGGTGLGLTVSDTIARAQGGTLTLTPRPAGGLVARITLPA